MPGGLGATVDLGNAQCRYERQAWAAGRGSERHSGHDEIARQWTECHLISRALIALLIACAAIGVLVLISGDTARAAVLEADTLLIQGLRTANDANDPLGPWWMTRLMEDITALGGRTVIGLIALLAVGYLMAIGRRALAAALIATIGGGVLANMALKATFARARPDVVSHLVEAHSSSFPSAHAMNSAIAYLAIGAMLASGQARRAVRVYIMAAAVAVTVLIGFSRVYLGVHWPSDVVAGWAVGACWVALCIRMVQAVRFNDRGRDTHGAALSS